MCVRSHQPMLTTDPYINTVSEDKEFNFTVPGFGWDQHFIMLRVRHYAFIPVQMNLLAEDVIDQRHVINVIQTREYWPEKSKTVLPPRTMIGPYGIPLVVPFDEELDG